MFKSRVTHTQLLRGLQPAGLSTTVCMYCTSRTRGHRTHRRIVDPPGVQGAARCRSSPRLAWPRHGRPRGPRSLLRITATVLPCSRFARLLCNSVCICWRSRSGARIGGRLKDRHVGRDMSETCLLSGLLLCGPRACVNRCHPAEWCLLTDNYNSASLHSHSRTTCTQIQCIPLTRDRRMAGCICARDPGSLRRTFKSDGCCLGLQY